MSNTILTVAHISNFMNSSRKFPPIFMPLKVIYVRKTPGGGGEECRGLENEMGGCDIQSNYTMYVFLLR